MRRQLRVRSTRRLFGHPIGERLKVDLATLVCGRAPDLARSGASLRVGNARWGERISALRPNPICEPAKELLGAIYSSTDRRNRIHRLYPSDYHHLPLGLVLNGLAGGHSLRPLVYQPQGRVQ
jgi:hypothetical protein